VHPDFIETPLTTKNMTILQLANLLGKAPSNAFIDEANLINIKHEHPL